MATLTPLQTFHFINEWLSSLKAREQAFEWIKPRLSEDERIREEGNQEALHHWQTPAALAWMTLFKHWEASPLKEAELAQGAQCLGALADLCEEDAERLEPVLTRRGESYRASEALGILGALWRAAYREEIKAKAHAYLAKERNLGEAHHASQKKAPRLEARMFALRRFEPLLEKEALESWDARMLRAQAASLPSQLRHEAMELRLLASDAQEGPAHLTPEAEAAWMDAGVDPAEAPPWLGAAFTAEEAAAWKKAGISDPAEAVEWSSRGREPGEAGNWIAAGFSPESADAWLGTGAAGVEEAAALKEQFHDPDSLRLWIRAGMAPQEALEFKRQGVKSPLQAAALKAGQAPSAAAAHGGPPPLKGLADATAAAASHAPSAPAPQAASSPVDSAARAAPSSAASRSAPPSPGGRPAAAPPEPTAGAPAPGGPLSWESAGVPKEAAAVWEAAYFTPQLALPWIDRGFNAKQAGAWQEAGILHPEKAKAWVDAGAATPDLAQALERRLGLSGADPGPSPAPASLALPCPEEAGAFFGFGSPADGWVPDAAAQGPELWIKRALSRQDAAAFKKMGAFLSRLSGAGAPLALCAQDTEHWARFSQPVEIRSPDLLSEWAPALEKAAQALNLPPGQPGFLLRPFGAAPPDKARVALFYGASFADVDGPPWLQSMDFLPSENWARRWWRKTDDWGEPGKRPQARVGMFGEKGKLRYLAALEDSILFAEPGDWTRLKKLDFKAHWREDWEDFSRVLDLPLRKPRWMLALAFFGEKPEPPEVKEEG